EGMTIIYTSHYMEEVEFLCERMAIMDHGSIIALGDQHELSEFVGNQREIVLTIKCEHGQNDIDRVRQFIHEVDPLKEIDVQGNQMKIFDQHPQQLLSHLIQGVTALNIQIISAEIVEPNLENVFLYLTSKNLRD
ncbi:export ABC transporter ATP-binding protein, partial [Bacillus pumilus]